jgi:hypothetical protein
LDTSNYTWELKIENGILKTKNYFRNEVIEKFAIQLNDYALHEMMHHKQSLSWIFKFEVTLNSCPTIKNTIFQKWKKAIWECFISHTFSKQIK